MRRLVIAVGMTFVVMVTVFVMAQSKNEVTLINNRAEPVTFETSVVAFPIREPAKGIAIDENQRDVFMATTVVQAHSKATLAFPHGNQEILRVSTFAREEAGARSQIQTRVTWGLRLRFIRGEGFELSGEPSSSVFRRWYDKNRKWFALVGG